MAKQLAPIGFVMAKEACTEYQKKKRFNMRLDEILAALPDVGLNLWMLDQVGDKWHASVYDPRNPLVSRREAEGSTPLEAMVEACKLAGVDVTDE